MGIYLEIIHDERDFETTDTKPPREFFCSLEAFVIQGLETKPSDFRVLSEGNLGRSLLDDKFDRIDNLLTPR